MIFPFLKHSVLACSLLLGACSTAPVDHSPSELQPPSKIEDPNTLVLRNAAHLLSKPKNEELILRACYPTLISTNQRSKVGFYPYYWPTSNTANPEFIIPNSINANQELSITRLYYCREDSVDVPGKRMMTPRQVNLWIPARRFNQGFEPFSKALKVQSSSAGTRFTTEIDLPDGAYCLHSGSLDPAGPLPQHCYPFMIGGFGIPEVTQVSFPNPGDGPVLNVDIANTGEGAFHHGMLVAVLAKKDGRFVRRLNLSLPEIAAGGTSQALVDFRKTDLEPGEYYVHGHVNYVWLYDANELCEFRSELFEVTE